jgi:hypothetical protein
VTPRVVYVAGPYAAATPAEVAVNVDRAIAVGRLAVLRRRAPIVPHAQGWLGVFGAADESEPGVRQAALRSAAAVARTVGEVLGEFWAIEREDGTLSDGTAHELEAYVRGAESFGVSHRRALDGVIRRAWWRWAADLEAEGIGLPPSDRLEVRPAPRSAELLDFDPRKNVVIRFPEGS